MHRIWILFLAITYFWGCSPKQDSVPAVTGKEYFPISLGDTAVYQVVKSDTSVSGNVINSNYFLKEVVSDTFLTLEKLVGYKVDRYVNPNSTSSSWTYDSTWYSYSNSFEAVRVENNVPYVKLSFPVKNNKQWDGNVKNNYGENKYKMINIDKKYQVGTLQFPRSLVVLQSSDTTYDRIVGQDKRLEVYAASVGLVYKESVIISINSSSNPISRRGVNYRQKLISYGKR